MQQVECHGTCRRARLLHTGLDECVSTILLTRALLEHVRLVPGGVSLTELAGLGLLGVILVEGLDSGAETTSANQLIVHHLLERLRVLFRRNVTEYCLTRIKLTLLRQQTHVVLHLGTRLGFTNLTLQLG
ncbi:hypothetical protein aldrigsur_1 [Escherichia phage aldrigsur]|nr:hypothetical protein aldrigsur_1 [Escherichia phage aldrigsur]